jgi:ubiquinone/menaquinone biosynthesis C-methylase UbiE
MAMERAELFHSRVFDQKDWAEGYFKRNAWNIAQTGKRISRLLKKSGFTSGNVLDTGCGFAAVPVEIAKIFPEVQITGIDLGEPLLEIGKELVEGEGFSDRITLMKGDVQYMPFEADSFDVVICSYMLHIVENPVKMLDEIERVAKPDARILLTDLRRGFLAHISKKLRTALTLDEALEIINSSSLRRGNAYKGPFWWDYRVA